MAIATSQLTVAQLDVVTVPAGKQYAILNILVCNNSGSAATFDLHFIPDGDSLNTNVNRVVNSVTVDAGDTFVWGTDNRIMLSAGDTVTFTASSNALSATVSWIE